MSGLVRITLTIITAITLLSGLAFLIILDSFEIKAARQLTLSFSHDGNRLEGNLWLPDGDGPHAIAVLVHGDGPQNRTAGGGYNPLINHLLKSGIGVFSWDKPGVGQSTGDWLAQSMADRAEEALAAYEAVRQQPETEDSAIGLIGFSQAGWVLPELALKSDSPAFHVIIGGAVTWAEQSLYLTRKRLEQEGREAEDIIRIADEVRQKNERLFGPDAAQAGGQVKTARDRFVALNYHADARPGLASLRKPFLALLGTEDLNVDTAESARVYREILEQSGHPDFEIHRLEGATHSLLRAEHFNFQTPGSWTGEAQLRFLLEGPDAYIPSGLERLSDWIQRVTGSSS